MRNFRGRGGQTLVEYVIALVFMVAAAAVAWHVVRASGKAADRAETLVSSEYP